MWNNAPLTSKPKSKTRHFWDAALSAVLAVVFVWAGVTRVQTGEISVRRWGIVHVAQEPGLFWILMAFHVVIVIGCTWFFWRSLRSMLLTSSKDRSWPS